MILLLFLIVLIGIYAYTKSILGVLASGVALWIGFYFFTMWTGFPTVVLNSEEPSGFDWLWTPSPVNSPEVFYVDGGRYTYKEAPNVCANYDAQLATYDQVLEAYAKGAEWCGYGWTQGGMALYPTQQSTWAFLQQDDDNRKRKSCGRPGINGGYMNTNSRFGVNCYGIKPEDTRGHTYPIPLGQPRRPHPIDTKHIAVYPFNRNGWSQWQV